MINQREIVGKIRGMRAMELLQLVLDYPHFLTDAYFADIAKAVQARYEELKIVSRNASLMRMSDQLDLIAFLQLQYSPGGQNRADES